MCLLHALALSAKDFGVGLHVGHLHHHMRAQADSDAKMVSDFAADLGIRCTVGHADVPDLARSLGVGLEEAGRIARYRFLRELKSEIGASKIALGHNLNDQAETVLMRLFRGAGTEGLAGIPGAKGDLIRPLLDVPRALIEEYCREQGIPTITDVYNLDVKYTRNLIRHEVLPYLAERFNPSLPLSLARSAAAMRWDADFLSAVAEEAFLASSFACGRVTMVERRAIDEMPRAIYSRVLELAWRECAGSDDNLPIERAMDLMLCPVGSVSLPGGVTAEKTSKWVGFYPPPPKGLEVGLLPGRMTYIPDLRLSVETRIVDASTAKWGDRERNEGPSGAAAATEAPSVPWLLEPVAHLDYNKLAEEIRLRTRRPGDRFAPLGMGGKEQKLQDFFVQRRVPRGYRDFVPLLVSGGKIAWVAGMRIGEEFRVTPETRLVLEISVRPYLRHSRNCATIWWSCPTAVGPTSETRGGV